MNDPHITREKTTTITINTNNTNTNTSSSTTTMTASSQRTTHSSTSHGRPPVVPPHTRRQERPVSILKSADKNSESTPRYTRRVSFEEEEDDFAEPRLCFGTPKIAADVEKKKKTLPTTSMPTTTITMITANVKETTVPPPATARITTTAAASSSTESSAKLHMEIPPEEELNEKRMCEEQIVSPTERENPHRKSIHSSPQSPHNVPVLTPRLTSQTVHSEVKENIDSVSSSSLTLTHPAMAITSTSELLPPLDVTVSDITQSPISVESHPCRSSSQESIQERNAIISLIKMSSSSELDTVRRVIVPDDRIRLGSHELSITPISLEGRNPELDISDESFSFFFGGKSPELLHNSPPAQQQQQQQQQKQIQQQNQQEEEEEKKKEETSKLPALIETDMRPIVRPSQLHTLSVSDGNSGTSLLSLRHGKANSVSAGVDPNDVVFDDSFIDAITIPDKYRETTTTTTRAVVSVMGVKSECLRKPDVLDNASLIDLPIHLYPPLLDTDEIPYVSTSTPISKSVSIPLDASLFQSSGGEKSIRNEKYIYAAQKPILFHKMFVKEKSESPLLISQSVSSFSGLHRKQKKIEDSGVKSIRTADMSSNKRRIPIKDRSSPSNSSSSAIFKKTYFPKRKAKPVLVEYVNKLSEAWQDKLREDDNNNNNNHNTHGSEKSKKSQRRWRSTDDDNYIPKHLEDKAKELFPGVFSSPFDISDKGDRKVIAWNGNVFNTTPLLPIRRMEIVPPKPVKKEKPEKKSKPAVVTTTIHKGSSVFMKKMKNNNSKPLLLIIEEEEEEEKEIFAKTSMEEKENINVLSHEDVEFEEIDSLHEPSRDVMSDLSSPISVKTPLSKKKTQPTPLKSNGNNSNFKSNYEKEQKLQFNTTTAASTHLDTESCVKRFEKLQRTLMQLAFEQALSSPISSSLPNADLVEDITSPDLYHENNKEDKMEKKENEKNNEKEEKENDILVSRSGPSAGMQRRNVLRAPLPSPLPSPPRQPSSFQLLTRSTEGLIRTPVRITPAESGEDESGEEQPSERHYLFPPTQPLASSLHTHTQYSSHYSVCEDKSIKRNSTEELPERCVTDRLAMKCFARDISAIVRALKGSGVSAVV